MRRRSEIFASAILELAAVPDVSAPAPHRRPSVRVRILWPDAKQALDVPSVKHGGAELL